MTISTLFIIVIILAVILFGVIVFLWFQFSSTDSALVKKIEDRIRLNKVNTAEGIEEEVKEE